MKEENFLKLQGLFKKAKIKAKKYGVDSITIHNGADEYIDITNVCMLLGNKIIVRCKKIGRKTLESWQIKELINGCKQWIDGIII